MLSFGVTVLPDPPYTRLIELTKLAESHGFEYGWTYDSHVLWQESMPVMALLADQTSTIKLGHMVTNPATRDPTVLASAYATLQDISNGRMIMGIGRGDSAVRYRRPQADEGRRLRGGAADDQAVHERQGGDLEREAAPAQVGAAGAAGDRDARRGLRAEGARGGRAAGRRRDHPARRPGHHPVDHGHGPEGGRGGRARPGGAQVHRQRAEPHLGRPRRRARAGALVPGDGLEPRPGPDRPLRHRRLRRSRRRSPTTSRRASSTTTASTPASARSTASS